MKRLTLMLAVAALAALSCTPTTTPVAPTSSTSSSTTQAGASAREAWIDNQTIAFLGIDPQRYPAGSVVEMAAELGSGQCALIGRIRPSAVGTYGDYGQAFVRDEIEAFPGTEICDPPSDPSTTRAVMLPGVPLDLFPPPEGPAWQTGPSRDRFSVCYSRAFEPGSQLFRCSFGSPFPQSVIRW